MRSAATLLCAGCTRSSERSVWLVTYTGLLEPFQADMARELGFFREEGVAVRMEHTTKMWEAVVGGGATLCTTGIRPR